MSCVDRVAKIIWQNDRSGLAGLVAEGIRYVQGKGEEESLSRNGWSGMASLRLMAWYRKIKNRIKNDKTIRKSSDLGALVRQSNADSGALRCSSSVFFSLSVKAAQKDSRDSKRFQTLSSKRPHLLHANERFIIFDAFANVCITRRLALLASRSHLGCSSASTKNAPRSFAIFLNSDNPSALPY